MWQLTSVRHVSFTNIRRLFTNMGKPSMVGNLELVHSYVHGPTSAFLLEVQCIMLLSLTNETRTFWVVSWRTDLKYLTSSRNRQLLWKTKHVWRLSVLSCTMRLNTKIKNLLIAMFNVGLLCWKQFLKHLNKRVWMVGWNICWKKGTISMRLHARLPNM